MGSIKLFEYNSRWQHLNQKTKTGFSHLKLFFSYEKFNRLSSRASNSTDSSWCPIDAVYELTKGISENWFRKSWELNLKSDESGYSISVIRFSVPGSSCSKAKQKRCRASFTHRQLVQLEHRFNIQRYFCLKQVPNF